MKYIKLFEDFSLVTETNITSIKKNGFLNVKIDDITYKCWFWNASAIKKDFLDKLTKDKSWIVEVEESNGTSKQYTVKGCLDISPYNKGDKYLDIEKAREILIDKAKEYHNSTK